MTLKQKFVIPENFCMQNGVTRVYSGRNPWKLFFDPFENNPFMNYRNWQARWDFLFYIKQFSNFVMTFQKNQIYMVIMKKNTKKKRKLTNRFSTFLAKYHPSSNYSSRFTKGQFSLNNFLSNMEL